MNRSPFGRIATATLVPMRNRILLSVVLAVLLLSGSEAKAQDSTEFVTHLRSVDETFAAYRLEDNFDSVFNTNRAFFDYTIAHLLNAPSDKYLLANRALLRPLNPNHCDSTRVSFSDTLSGGNKVSINLLFGPFDPAEHTIVPHPEYDDTIGAIDGMYPLGGVYGTPSFEIKQLSVSIDGNRIAVPDGAFKNLYHPNVCDGDDYFSRPVEAFSSMDGRHIHLYIYGGENASTYFSKLVFSRTEYVTRIIADYWSLSMHGCFRSDFIGF